MKMQVAQVAVAAATALGLAIIACSSDSGQQGGACADGELMCNGLCVEPMTDTANCGGCGTQCAGAQLCSSGVCSLTCSPGTTQCATSCSDVKVDPQNCGGCGNACGVGQVCSGGMCVAQCPSSAQTVCTGDAGVSCVTTTTDGNNCGGCGNVCAPGKVCSGGMCTDTCGAGETLCPSGGEAGAPYCASMQGDQANCGKCGNVCATGLVCSAGTCQAQCSPPLALCGTQCVDTTSDPDNCGGCGKAVCKGATPTCSSGTCVSGVTYSQSLSGTVLQADARCVAWNTFQAALTGAYTTVKISGSNDGVGKTCTGAAANQICKALHNNTVVSVACNGRTWNVGNCSVSGYQSELSADGNTCACDTGYIARPCIGNNNWGGINSTTCSASTQTITVSCQ